MKALRFSQTSLALAAAALLAACGGEAPAPPAAPPAPVATAPKAPAKITAIAFAAPIVDTQLETWKSFLADASGARETEWDDARVAAGLTREVVWHQATPAGDFAVVYQEGPDLAQVMPHFGASETPIDKDFVAMIQAVHGMDPTKPTKPNALVLNYTGDGTRAIPYGFAVPIAEGQEAAADAFVAELSGARKAEFAESRTRQGIVREHVWRQGNMFVVVQESPEPDQIMVKWVASEHEFDVWFLDQVNAFTGLDLRQPTPANTMALNWEADSGGSADEASEAPDEPEPTPEEDEG